MVRKHSVQLIVFLCGLVLLAACTSKPDCDQLFSQAEKYYQERKLVEALESFKDHVKNCPESERASRCAFMIGFIYANDMKDIEQAREAYESFLQNYPDADEGLRASAEWELEHLGSDISEVDFLQDAESE